MGLKVTHPRRNLNLPPSLNKEWRRSAKECFSVDRADPGIRLLGKVPTRRVPSKLPHLLREAIRRRGDQYTKRPIGDRVLAATIQSCDKSRCRSGDACSARDDLTGPL